MSEKIPIKKEDYFLLKQKINANPDIDLAPIELPFLDKYKVTMILVIGSLICFLIFLAMDSLICIIFALIGGFALFDLIINGSAYASHMHKQNEAYKVLKEEIKNSSNYDEFFNRYYD
jgi:hypothetical protein